MNSSKIFTLFFDTSYFKISRCVIMTFNSVAVHLVYILGGTTLSSRVS